MREQGVSRGERSRESEGVRQTGANANVGSAVSPMTNYMHWASPQRVSEAVLDSVGGAEESSRGEEQRRGAERSRTRWKQTSQANQAPVLFVSLTPTPNHYN